MTFSLLSLCARLESHGFQQKQLAIACRNFENWDELLFLAEEHGMAPLLHQHLKEIEAKIPESFQRGARFLCLRHKEKNRLLKASLQQILTLLNYESVPCIVLKGGALANTLYQEPGLRPMRDIDLFFSKEDVTFAYKLLQKHGFTSSIEKIPPNYYHLPPLIKKEDGMQVCVELHQGLFPNDPPYYEPLDFKESYRNAISFDVDGVTAYSLRLEEMLWHLYQHGFHAPLTYESYRLISVADIVSLVESKINEISWGKLSDTYPQLYNALPLFHYLTPWNRVVLDRLPELTEHVPGQIGEPFKGWPRSSKIERSDDVFWQTLRNTLLPGQWWMMLYYGVRSGLSRTWCRLVLHPVHILRWCKIYLRMYLREKLSN